MVRTRDMQYIQLWVKGSEWEMERGSRAQGSKIEDQGQGRRLSSQWMDWMKGRQTDGRSRKNYSQVEGRPEVEQLAEREEPGGWVLVCRAA